MTISPPISTADRDKAMKLYTAFDEAMRYSDMQHFIHTKRAYDEAARTAIPSYEARVVELEAALQAAEANAQDIDGDLAEAESDLQAALALVEIEKHRAEASDARATALLEALTPFAKMAPDSDEWDNIILSVPFCTPEGNATVGDLRRAAIAAQQDRQTEG